MKKEKIEFSFVVVPVLFANRPKTSYPLPAMCEE